MFPAWLVLITVDYKRVAGANSQNPVKNVELIPFVPAPITDANATACTEQKQMWELFLRSNRNQSSKSEPFPVNALARQEEESLI